MYRVVHNQEGWQIMKDGHFFCLAESEFIARSLCDSLNKHMTPSKRYTIDDLFDRERPANEATRRYLGFHDPS